MKTLEDNRREVVRALKTAGRYSRGLEMQIRTLATAMRTLDLATRDIDDLECVTVWEETRYGHKLAPHPAFKIQKDAQDSVTRQMKALGLTAEMLTGSDDNDPLINLTEAVMKAGRNKETIRPRGTDDGGRQGEDQSQKS